ncbi:MAG: hypothetical protein UW75_C0040G0004 [Parcubacteria group bacterium GW2011_GWF2_44_8]|nr:MAG: hypothetical protein UW75_C0040G0004 [Parcubacteria group bacterium GW2011_GWF2_44_8]
MLTCTFENNSVAHLRHVTVTVLVLRQNQILLEKRGTYLGKPLLESGKWALLGGYADRDENLEGTARREIMEEGGWTLNHLQLLRINDNPNRPKEDRQNIEMVFFAQAGEKVGVSNEEAAELHWFDLDMLPEPQMMAFDHLEAIELYKSFLKQPFALPKLG